MLLERILDSNRTPEEACREDPDLLPIVRERLERLRSLESKLAEVLPGGDELRHVSREFLRASAGSPPPIPGYDMLEMVGSGGMGVVYRARHLRLNRSVAIKMLLAGGFAGARELAFGERFVPGYKAASTVDMLMNAPFDE